MDRMYPSSFRMTVTPLNEETALGILKHLNKDELQKLLDDDSKLEELITDDQQVKQLDVTKENLMTSNKSIAEYNLSQEPRLESAKKELAKAYEDFVKVQKKYEELKKKYDLKSSEYSLETVYALLQTEAAKTDEESEKIAEDFLEGTIEVDTFLERYISKRAKAHQHKVQAEKMLDILQSGAVDSISNKTAPVPGYNQVGAAPYHAAPYLAASWGVPYPPGNMVMPNAENYLPK